MNTQQLIEQIKTKGSFLCIGLDSDIKNIPKSFLNTEHPQFEYNKSIIEATHAHTVAYKINPALYENRGWKGIRDFELTESYIKNYHKNILCIADIKGAETKPVSTTHAHTFFEYMDFDAVTLVPHMGTSAIEPFLHYPNKVVIITLLSSRESLDLEKILIENTSWPLYSLIVPKISHEWNMSTSENTMFLLGDGAQNIEMSFIRRLLPNHFLLMDSLSSSDELANACKHIMNDQCGMMACMSNNIIFGNEGDNSPQNVARNAQRIAKVMSEQLHTKGIL